MGIAVFKLSILTLILSTASCNSKTVKTTRLGNSEAAPSESDQQNETNTEKDTSTTKSTDASDTPSASNANSGNSSSDNSNSGTPDPTTDGIAPSAPQVINIESSALALTLAWTASPAGATPAGYLLVRRVGSAVTWNPTTAASYISGQVLDANHTVVYVGSSLDTEDAVLSVGAIYYYALFAYDSEKDYSAAKTSSKLLKKHIYRSVEAEQLMPLATGDNNALTITNNIATFSQELPNNVGVGDGLEYDSDNNGSIEHIAFISRRISASSFYVHAADGSNAENTAVSDQDWKIFRAYTSLSNAEDGVENTAFSAAIRNFELFANGLDLTDSANDDVWNIALYAGNDADQSRVNISGWTTGPDNYLKIYTPTKNTEVGVSQRHSGVWSDFAHRLVMKYEPWDHEQSALLINTGYVKLEGLQVYIEKESTFYDSPYAIRLDYPGAQDISISNSIVRGSQLNTVDSPTLIIVTAISPDPGAIKIWNNMLYDALTNKPAKGTCIADLGSNNISLFAYNNTIYNCQYGMNVSSGKLVSINNIVQAIDDGFVGTFEATSNYNTSNFAADAPGADSVQSATVVFADAGNRNLTLDITDTVAVNKGANLSEDQNLSFLTDIQGDLRSETDWTLGADGSFYSAQTSLAPIAYSQSLNAPANGSSNFRLVGSDINGDSLSYAITSQPSHGTLDVSNIPAIKYTPNASYTGTDQFSFTVSDGSLVSSSALVNFTIANYHRIAYTNIAYYAGVDVNSLADLDLVCQQEATASGAGGGTWKAVASSEAVDAKDHISIAYPIINRSVNQLQWTQQIFGMAL